MPSVAQTAASAVAKLSGYTPDLAGDVVSLGLLPIIVEGLKADNVRL